MNTSATPSPWNTVWIIGASFGIGRAFAELCSSRGAKVIASARSADALDDMASEDENIVALPFDATSADEVSGAVARIETDGLLPDLTLYNAGFYEPVTSWRVDADLFATHMAVNYLGAVYVLSELLPPLAARGKGHVALVASLSGYCGLPKAAAYGPSKAALISLCESMKLETDAAGLDLSVVNPGFVDTRMTAKNDFRMPHLMKPAEAAREIYDGLARKQFEVAFPKAFVRRLKFARLLPYGLYFRLMKRLVS